MAKGIRPQTMAKYLKAKRLFDDKSNDITLDIACARAGITRHWFYEIARRVRIVNGETKKPEAGVETKALDEVHGRDH